jgi:hypothetical protein
VYLVARDGQTRVVSTEVSAFRMAWPSERMADICTSYFQICRESFDFPWQKTVQQGRRNL